jgi:voltage-gated potassium channel
VEFKKRIRDTLLAVTFTFLTGVVGYQWIEGWSFLDSAYMTLITLATIGYGETHPLSEPGRVFTMFLILSGLSTFSYGAFTLTSLVAEGNLERYVSRKRMNKAIAQLKDHYIVCGAGAIAHHTINELLQTGKQVVIIDSDEQSLEKFRTAETIAAAFGKPALAGKAFFIQGDAWADKVLLAANVEQAAGLFCVFREDKDNLFVVLSARALNRTMRIVARCQEEESAGKFSRAGADIVVSPNRIGGLRMVSEMIRPTVVSFLDFMVKDPEGFRFEEVTVRDVSPFLGKALRETPLGSTPGTRVVALAAEGGRYAYSPSEETQLSPGQRFVVLMRSVEVERLRKALNGQA